MVITRLREQRERSCLTDGKMSSPVIIIARFSPRNTTRLWPVLWFLSHLSLSLSLVFCRKRAENNRRWNNTVGAWLIDYARSFIIYFHRLRHARSGLETRKAWDLTLIRNTSSYYAVGYSPWNGYQLETTVLKRTVPLLHVTRLITGPRFNCISPWN